ncbi:MAG: transposase [Candidatus Lokiarchaeota archaeon]|nr:transposase [Candidatus Lokiarchaeota archaeon]
MTTTTITRIFSLIPTSPYKKDIYKNFQAYFVKFRDLENLFIKTLIYALNKGHLSLQDFSGTSTSHIKRKIYNHLELNKIKAAQWKSIDLKERVHRCAIIHPYHAVRIWLIRNENLSIILSELIELFASDPSHIIWFLKGKQPPKPVLKCLFRILKKDPFGTTQFLTSFHLTNMIGQLRNIFLSNTQLEPLFMERFKKIKNDEILIDNFLRICLGSFSRKKKREQITLTPEQLYNYFLELYFRKIKWLSTRYNKMKMSTLDFICYKKQRDTAWDVLKKEFISQQSQFSLKDLNSLMVSVFQEVLTELETHSSNLLPKNVFNPFLQKKKVDYLTPTYHQFLIFFQKQLKDKMKEMLSDLFLVDSIVAFFIAKFERIRIELPGLINVLKIKRLSIPIQNLRETQVYNSNLENLKVTLSFVSREFHTFIINDKKGRIKEFLEKGAYERPPIICSKQGKMFFYLPFYVKKKSCLKQAPHENKNLIELGIDLGLKHFAVLSIMDKSDPSCPKEIMRYFLGQKQLFDMKFNTITGKFKPRQRGPNHIVNTPTNIKLKLINIRSEIKLIQQKLHTYQNRLSQKGISNSKRKFKYNRLKIYLERLWERISHINKEIVNLLNHTILKIANHHHVSVIKCENLKWTRHSKRKEVGQFLAFWQILWFFSQIQSAIQLRAHLNAIEFKTKNARNTSQKCSTSGHMGQRTGKAFFCPHCEMSLDSDLNAARNIALC